MDNQQGGALFFFRRFKTVLNGYGDIRFIGGPSASRQAVGPRQADVADPALDEQTMCPPRGLPRLL